MIIEREKFMFISEVLGSAPNNSEIYSDYIASKAPDAKKMKEEIADFESGVGVEGIEERMITVFPRDEDDNPFVYDYTIKGLLKDSCGFLRNVKGSECSKVKAYKKKIDGLIFPTTRRLYFAPAEGKKAISISDCQRPLRAQTPLGERNALAISETIEAGTTLSFELLIMDDSLLPMVHECFAYGKLHGFGQWRNSGKGRFLWEHGEPKKLSMAEVLALDLDIGETATAK